MKQAYLSATFGALCLLSVAPETRAQPAPAPDHVETVELMLVEATINGTPMDGNYLVARRGGGFLVREEDLQRWRVMLPSVPVETIDGERFVPLDSVEGARAAFSTAQQRLDLTIPEERFARQDIAITPSRMRPTQGAFAAFLNYDLVFEYDDRVTAAAFVETGVSDDWGLLTNTMTVASGAGADGVTRLDTAYVRDFPEHLLRLVAGDTVTDARDWSRQVRFGGVRFGTEFGLQPELVTFPVPEFAGRAAIPSSVELLVNDAVRYRIDVAQGPFTINRLPVVTGAGDVTVVVRDALGVERRVQTSYYVSSRLLRRGLSDWSLEAGAVRRNYGLRSFDYGNAFVAGSYRQGVTDWLTLESRAEVSGDVQMAGAGANVVWPTVGEFGAAGALSRGEEGQGWLYRAYLSRITPDWSLSASYLLTSRNFDELGVESDAERIVAQLQVSGGLSFGRWGSLGASWTDLEYAEGDRSRIASANYSISIGDRAYFNLFALRSRFAGLDTDTMVGIGLTVPLGPRTSAHLQADSRNIAGELQLTPPYEGGWGYRLAASEGESDRQQAELRWRGEVGEASVELARLDGKEGVRAMASGGLLLAGKHTYATRRVADGLGVIEVPGQAGVRIYQENRQVAVTDAAGLAVIPDLRAYEANRISLAPSDLPLDASMTDDAMIVVPRYRGAALARFEVAHERPATVVVTMPDGRLVEAGTDVRSTTGETTFVGYDGEVFVNSLRSGMVIELDTRDGPCRVTVPDVSVDEVLPRVGPLRCTTEGATP